MKPEIHLPRVYSGKISLGKTMFPRAKVRSVTTANIGDPQTTWKVLKDLIGKKSAATEIDDILTGSNVTLNSAQEVANHFNFQYLLREVQILPLIFVPRLLVQKTTEKRLFFFLICSI